MENQKSEAAAGRARVHASRPKMPDSYGIHATEEGLLAWEWAEERLRNSHNYWIATAGPDGRPHAMPVWGVWLNGAFYFSTDATSRKGRNLTANPAVVMHLESGDEAVIVEGRVERVQDQELLKQIDNAYFDKYQVHIAGAPGDSPVLALRPAFVLGWREKNYSESATRWSFLAIGK